MLTFARHTPAATRRSVVRFQGLDRTAGAGEGWFVHQEGLSTRRHPYLSPARADKVEALSDCTGLFVWDDVRVLARAGQLWYGEEPVCNLTDGDKQFAVINSKLVVWPDAVAVDLTEGTVTALSAQAVNRGTATFTTHSLTLQPESVYARTDQSYRAGDGQRPWLWTYAGVAWDETNGWTLEGGEWTLPTTDTVGRYYIPGVTYSDKTDSYTAAPPRTVFDAKAPADPGGPDNELGFYALVTGLDDLFVNIYSYQATLHAHIYWARQAGQPLDRLFRVGQAVSVAGTACGALDVEKRIIRAIDPATNTLTFDPDTFRAGDAVGRLTGDISGALCVVWTADGSTNRRKANDFTGKAGWYVVADRSAGVLRVYDGDWALQGEYECQSVSSTAGLDTLTLTPMRTTAMALTVTRPIPPLDHICQHDNRLWGVCSGDNTVYASALGDPYCFYTYDGLSTDSWAVAVGSAGPFTAICSYGGGVLCWKEDGLHKVLGTLPDNYQLATYTLPGVARDSSASLVAVAQQLYYLGRDGVYCWSGGLPRLLSQGLGEEPLTAGVGGTDGKCYYLSVLRGQETELLVYDVRLGLWTRRDGRGALAFARGGAGLMCLTEQGVATLEAGDGVMDWQGVLAPMYESLDRVQYTHLRLRAHLEPGSRVTVEARYDDGRWQRLGTVRASGHRVAELNLPLRRCALLQLRLSGQGDCTLLELERAYRKRGRG